MGDEKSWFWCFLNGIGPENPSKKWAQWVDPIENQFSKFSGLHF